MLVAVNGYLADIDGPGSEIDVWWEVGPDIWTGGDGTCSYGVAGEVVSARLGTGAVTLEYANLFTGGG